MIVTIYRCYWPEVHGYLKSLNLSRKVEDTFGHVFSLNLETEHLRAIQMLLPLGAIIEVVESYSYNKDLVEVQDILRAYSGTDQDN